MRIGILTFHRAYNCGAMLQAWALKTVLERKGHNVEFPDCNHVGDAPRWPSGWVRGCRRNWKFLVDFTRRLAFYLMSIPSEDIARRRYRRFGKKYLNIVPCSISGIPERYDLLVEGSDQVWTEWIVSREQEVFLLKGIDKSVPVIAYAASAGDMPLSKNWLTELETALLRYKAISVREEGTRRQIVNITDKKVPVVADPTLLLTKGDYDLISSDPNIQGKFIYVYAIRATNCLLSIARKIATAKGLKLVITPIGQFSRLGAPRGLTYSVSPERMVGYIKNAEYVITNSFHGTMLALIYNKKLLSVLESGDLDYSRQAMILRRVGELARVVVGELPLKELIARLDNPLPDSVEVELSRYREESLKWLESCGI